MTNKTTLLLPALLGAGIGIHTAGAAEIPTNTAQMQAMDKITGRVSVINVPVNAEMRFGSFSIVVRDCKTRSPEETPENFAFVDVADTIGENQQVNIFKGWMLSSSPALNAVEHPVYDVWLLKCIDTDIADVPLMSADELAARDRLPMQRPETREVPAPQEENGFEEVNLSGEPIDLLPAAVREAGEENAAQEQIIKLEAEKDVIAEENAPQSLLNIPEQPAAPGDEEIKEIKAQIEIRENAAEGGESEIKSDARVLSLPQPATTGRRNCRRNSFFADRPRTAAACPTAREYRCRHAGGRGRHAGGRGCCRPQSADKRRTCRKQSGRQRNRSRYPFRT